MPYTESEAHLGNAVTHMTVTLKPKITPKLSGDELQDQQEIGDSKVREHIRKSNADYVAGRSRPAKDFLSELRGEVGKPRKKRSRSA